MTTPRTRHTDPLEALRLKKAALDARIRKLETRLSAKSRKEDTRLKILVGAAFLADASKHPELEATINTTLDRAITNPKDRSFLHSKGYPHRYGTHNS